MAGASRVRLWYQRDRACGDAVSPASARRCRGGGRAAPGFRDGERDHVDQLCEEWLELARGRGIPVHDKHGDLLPDVDDAITHTVSAAIWFGLTTGYCP